MITRVKSSITQKLTQPFFACFLICIAGFICYANSFDNSFHFDDFDDIARYRFLKKPEPRDETEELLAEEDWISAGPYDFSPRTWNAT